MEPSPGIPPEVWDYIRSVEVAGRYDHDHAAFALFDLDTELTLRVLRSLPQPPSGEPPTVLDLGCGTGRTLIAVAREGAQAIGLDLSPHMLDRAAHKVAEAGVGERVRLFRGDLAALRFLDDASVDLAVCLYATLGLVRGHETRVAALRGIRRVLRPGGLLLVHVHNRYFPGFAWRTWRWLWRSWRDARHGRGELGDLYFDDYAGAAVRRMFMHAFGPRELRQHMQQAGLHLRELLYIQADRRRLLTHGRLRVLRSNGFFALAAR